MGKERKHPMQRIELDDHGVIRFRMNKIIRDAVDSGAIDLNKIAVMDYSAADRMQLAQLIGYSVSGYGDLSYSSQKSVRIADGVAEKLRRKREQP